MSIDYSTELLIDGASGLLFLAVGVFALVVGRHDRRGARVGAFALAVGVRWTLSNFWQGSGPLRHGGIGLTALGVALTSLALAQEIARGFSRRERLVLLAVAGVLVVTLGVESAIETPQDVAKLGSSILLFDVPSAFESVGALLLVATAALAYRVSAPGAIRERRAFACIALTLGLFEAFILSILAPDDAWFVASAIGAIGTVAALATWLLAIRPDDARLARRVLFALLAMTLVGEVFGGLVLPALQLDTNHDYGANGVVRTVGVFLLVVGIVRYDLLRSPLPSLAARRGTLAGGALALLFIVAQVAQNFFAAQYGLILGGVVAGTFLFAAQPIQRAIEGRSETKSSEPVVGEARDDHRIATYRDAVRYVLADGEVTRKEEAHLADLAQHLGIGAGDAMRIRHEVEDERR